VALATTVRCASITIPGAATGPENPLPPLHAPAEPHHIDDLAGLPQDMARQIGLAPPATVLPYRRLDAYGRERTPRRLTALVVENERLRATVLPEFGGRLCSLVHKEAGAERELLYRNPVLQPAGFALNGAWFSGGVEWNIGATGHTPLTCAPLHAARLTAPDGGEMLRLWEWERMRDLPFQVDLWLPADSAFLHVGVRIRNPHAHDTATYWWSNIAVPETPGTRVLAPAEEAWHFGYERSLRRVPVPEWDGTDRTYPTRSEHAADYFYEVPPGSRKWIAAVDETGSGLVQTSTDLLRGRKLFLWGTGSGGRRWQEWLTEPGTGGYLEIQAGLARTQLEHVPLEAGQEFAWLEAYGPVHADPAAAHGPDWAAARAEVERRLEEALPRAEVDAAFAAWRPFADAQPKEVLAIGSGWGALEVALGQYDLPGTPFGTSDLGPDILGPAQQPWRDLLEVGGMREARAEEPPGPTLVGRAWRDMLETAAPSWLTEYHLGVAQWHAGDKAQAVRSWERSMDRGASPWALRCLGQADLDAGETARGAQRLLDAVDAIDHVFYHTPVGTPPSVALAALTREAVEALLAAGRPDEARTLLTRLPRPLRHRGRFLLLHARLLLAEGDPAGAKEVFDNGFEVDDLHEGDETLHATWTALTERLVAGDGPITDGVRERAREQYPLPRGYDFRMRP
jgi:tetratricopeptide (TPR) repeat protein